MMPLEGIRILDVSTILAGPLCCQILGDFGADVIKIEHPSAGDNMRGHGYQKDGTPLWWKEISRNKRTIGLDWHIGDGAAVFRKLAATSDVVVGNFVEHRHGNCSTNNAPRNMYRTSDGSWVAVSTSSQAIAERVLRLVGHPEVIDEPWFGSGRGRVAHADMLDHYVAGWIADRNREEVLRAFTEAGAAVGPVYDTEDIVNDPHIRTARMLTTVPDEDLGPLLMHNVMWRMSETPGQIRFTGRRLGADTDAILTGELGYDPAEVARLRDEGVVR